MVKVCSPTKDCGRLVLPITIPHPRADRFIDVYEPTLESNYTISTQHHKQAMVLRLREIGAGGFPARATAGVDGYILVFSCASLSSFHAIIQLHDTLAMLVGNASAVARVLVAMHADCGDSRQVQRGLALLQAEQWRCPYVEASAKEGDRITAVFQTMLNEIDVQNSFGARASTPGQQRAATLQAGQEARKRSCCSAVLQAITFGYYHGRPSAGNISASPTHGLQQRLLTESSAASPTSPTEASPFGFKKVYPEISAANEQPWFLRVAPSQHIDVGSMRTGIQLAPYPGYPTAAVRLEPSFGQRDGQHFFAFANSDGAGYFIPDRVTHGFVPEHASTEDGSTGGTPHFHSDAVMQRVSLLAAREATNLADFPAMPPLTTTSDLRQQLAKEHTRLYRSPV
jgi:hypothetical protein